MFTHALFAKFFINGIPCVTREAKTSAPSLLIPGNPPKMRAGAIFTVNNLDFDLDTLAIPPTIAAPSSPVGRSFVHKTQ